MPIKIGIYIPNRKVSNVVLSDPAKGNPGMGATQYLMFSLPVYLKKYYDNLYDFVLLVNSASYIESGFKTIAVKNISEAAEKAKELSCDILIFRPEKDHETMLFLKIVCKMELLCIAWMHNTPRLLLNKLSKNKNIVRCICVSRDQYETLRDHPIIDKLTCIFNGIDPETVVIKDGFKKTKSLVFLGDLSFPKGFHIIAKCWKKIVRIHPDAKMIVIGSGRLYNRDKEQGKLGLAEAPYENLFRKYIVDANGNLINSIKFVGVLGPEKFSYMSQACVGIVNNPALRETFCLSAVEFQLCETPVVSKSYGGLRDTVKDGIGGILRNSPGERLKGIIHLMNNPELALEMGHAGRSFVVEKFNYKNICREWDTLFDDVFNSRPASVLRVTGARNSKLDQFREALRTLKASQKVFRIFIPSIYILHTIEYLRLKVQKILYSL